MTREIKFRAWDGEHMDYELEEACVQESGINFIARYMQGYQGYVLMGKVHSCQVVTNRGILPSIKD